MTETVVTNSLSARLLALTIFFVMVVEIFVFPTSIARFMNNYMEDRVELAYLSYLSINAAFEDEKQMVAAEHILNQLDVYQIQIYDNDVLMNKIRRFDPPLPRQTFDLRNSSFIGLAYSAFQTLISTENQILRVIGVPRRDHRTTLSVDFEEAPLRAEMLAHLQEVLAVSILISVTTAMLIFITIQVVMVNPIRDLTQSMTRFRQGPDNAENVIVPTGRSDEVGIAEHELSQMQEQIRAALRQKERLAAIGAAVTKINHDLRGMLSTAQLVSDRLSRMDDPEVQAAAPAIINSINKAVDLCSQTLKYAREGIPTLSRSHFFFVELIHQLVEQVRGLTQGKLEIQADIPVDITLHADKEQLYRVFINLCKNAFEAGASQIAITVTRHGNTLSIWVSDNGPGLPAVMLEKLFKPFAGSTRKGGSGLGLSICKEILNAHGGDMTLAENSNQGATFKLDINAPKLAFTLEKPKDQA